MQKRENWVFGSECGKALSGHEERKQRLWMPRPLSLPPPHPVPVAGSSPTSQSHFAPSAEGMSYTLSSFGAGKGTVVLTGEKGKCGTEMRHVSPYSFPFFPNG